MNLINKIFSKSSSTYYVSTNKEKILREMFFENFSFKNKKFVIFLDFDNVLNSYYKCDKKINSIIDVMDNNKEYFLDQTYIHPLQDYHIEQLNNLIDHIIKTNELEIVISSTWRHTIKHPEYINNLPSYNLPSLKKLLSDNGFKHTNLVVDSIPYNFKDFLSKSYYTDVYIESKYSKEELEEYVFIVIDDYPIDEILPTKVNSLAINTKENFGLNNQVVDKFIKLMSEDKFNDYKILHWNDVRDTSKVFYFQFYIDQSLSLSLDGTCEELIYTTCIV